MTDTRVVPCGLCGHEQRQDIAVLCLACGTTLHGDLRAVRTLLGLLRDTAARLARIDRGTPGSDDDIRRTLDSRYALTAAVSPSPVDFAAADAGHAIETAVAALCAALGPETKTGAPRFNPDNPGTTESRTAVLADWAADRWTLIRHATWAPTHAQRLNQATRHAWALVDTPPETWFAGYCNTELIDPEHGTTAQCGWTLQARLIDDIVTCRGCGTHHDVVERRRRMLDTIGDVRVTAADAARALSTPTRPITAAMIRGWKHRGHLEPATDTDDQGGTRPAVNDHGQPLYRLADVITADNHVRYGTTTRSAS